MKTLIIDGSNVVRIYLRLPVCKENFDKESHMSEIMLQMLHLSNLYKEYHVEAYFDGGKRIIKHPNEIDVIFSKGKKADDLIVNSVYEVCQNYRREALVITQDRNLIERCRQYGSRILRTVHFLEQMRNAFPTMA